MNKLDAWSAISTGSVPFRPSLNTGVNLVKITIDPNPSVRPEKILRSFNSRAFRREQPSDPQLMLQVISKAIAAGAPIQFVLYWGKGPRCSIDAPDIECLDFLASFARRVGESFEPGANFKLIFTDTHAELNGHPPSGIRRYFEEIKACALGHGFSSCRLSELTRAAEASAGAFDCELPPDLKARLVASAKKWYRGEGTAEDGAREYYQINMIELRAVEFAFPDSIFITYNSPDFRDLCPKKLPVFYMYTLRRGYRIKPWFLPEPSRTENMPLRQTGGF